MKSQQKIKKLFSILLEEIEVNEELRKKVEDLLEYQKQPIIKSESVRPKNKREKAVLDPIELVDLGIDKLKEKLEELDIEKLKDIISEFRLDTSRLALKWKDRSRLTDFIIKAASSRAKKGDVFR